MKKPLLMMTLLLGLLRHGLAQAPNFQLHGDTLILPSPIVFWKDLARFKPESQPGLEYLLAYLNDRPYVTKLRIESYTDTALPPRRALSLSKSRAMAIAEWLVQHNVDCRRLVPVGFGSENATGGVEQLLLINAAIREHPVSEKPEDGGGELAGDICDE